MNEIAEGIIGILEMKQELAEAKKTIEQLERERDQAIDFLAKKIDILGSADGYTLLDFYCLWWKQEKSQKEQLRCELSEVRAVVDNLDKQIEELQREKEDLLVKVAARPWMSEKPKLLETIEQLQRGLVHYDDACKEATEFSNLYHAALKVNEQLQRKLDAAPHAQFCISLGGVEDCDCWKARH